MSVNRRILPRAAVALLGLLPRLAAGQGSIGPVQHLQAFPGFRGAGVTAMIRAGDLAYFTVQGVYTPQSLWRSDGTLEGTFALDLTGGLRFWTVEGSRVFFTRPRAQEAGGLHRDLWRSDGTVEGTVALTQGLSLAVDASAGDPPTSLAVLEAGEAGEAGLVFFSAGAEGAQPDSELWATDGTPEGTRLVKDVNPEGPSNPSLMAALGGQLFFLADTPQGRELWRSNGTPEGTERVESLHHLGDGVVALVAAGDTLFLLAETAVGVELWAAGGDILETGEAILILETSEPGSLDLFAFGNSVLFAHSEAGYGLEPWLSDGTPEGTRRIADLCPGPCDSSPAFSGLYRGRAVLLADDGILGREPWLTDGTTAGTHPIGDLCPGSCSFPLRKSEEVNGWLALSTSDQIWISDGTGIGTFKAAELLSGVVDPMFLPLRDRVLIATLTPVVAGFLAGELRSLPVTAPPPPPAIGWFESARVPGFRFQVWIEGQAQLRQVPACAERTLCIGGAPAGRSEVFLRVSPSNPEGRLWPAVVKLTTAAVEVWALQTATGHLRHYRLDATDPAGSTLEGILDRGGFQAVPGALESAVGEARAARPPQPPGRWIESKTVPGFRVQARLASGRKSRILRKEPCAAETFCLGGATPETSGLTELLVRVAGPNPNGYLWPTLARFTPAALEVWIEQTKTGKVRYYRLNAFPNGSSELDGYVDRQGFKPSSRR